MVEPVEEQMEALIVTALLDFMEQNAKYVSDSFFMSVGMCVPIYVCGYICV